MPIVNRIGQAGERGPCDHCGKPTRSPYGVCALTPECRAEYRRRYRAGRLPSTTSPCDICGRPTKSDLCVCTATDACTMEYLKRWRASLPRKLAAAQGWLCAWCKMPLPADLDKTDMDHILPKSYGGPDELWNLQVLHQSCNRSSRAKGNHLTPEVVRLAFQHGIAVLA